MPTFEITYYEGYTRTTRYTVEVQADTEDEAKELWNYGDGAVDPNGPIYEPCLVDEDCYSYADDPEVEFHAIKLIAGSEEDDAETRGIPRDHPQLFEAG